MCAFGTAFAPLVKGGIRYIIKDRLPYGREGGRIGGIHFVNVRSRSSCSSVRPSFRVSPSVQLSP